MKDTKIISAFPGVGKTHFFNQSKLFVLDSDSSYFNKEKFPSNYIEHIKSYIGKVDYILVSSHKEVRESLFENDIRFHLVIPSIDQKQDYINRYLDRGSDDFFVELISANWNLWINDCTDQEGCFQYELSPGKYLSDIINEISN